MENKKTKALGMFIVLAAAIIWGSTGVAGEYLINQRGLDSAWITTYRTTFGGLVMLIILSFKMKGELFKVWKNKKDAIQMVIFGLFGVGMNLYFYMLAVQHTNAPTATTLQYLSPTMIVIYTAIRNRKFPSVKEIIAVICALAGVFAISTHGNLHSLAITTTGLIIGLFAAFFLAYIRVGADLMSRRSDVQNELVSIIQAVLILFVTAERFMAGWKQREEAKKALKGEA